LQEYGAWYTTTGPPAEPPLPPTRIPAAHLAPRQQVAVACALLPVLAVWQANGLYLAALAQRGALAFWAVDLCQWVVLPTLLVGLLAQTAALRPRDYGLGVSALDWRYLPWQATAVFATAGPAFVVARNLSWRVVGPAPLPWPLPKMFPEGLAGTATWIYASLSAGLVESIFFIGLPWLLYASLGKAPPRPLFFTLVASALFALAHWEQGIPGVIAAFCSHLVLCAWFFRTGTLWPVACGHAMVDLALLA
jgi:hypothetical protein